MISILLLMTGDACFRKRLVRLTKIYILEAAAPQIIINVQSIKEHKGERT